MAYRQTARSTKVRQASRAKLLASARKLFGSQGYEATTMQQIVRGVAVVREEDEPFTVAIETTDIEESARAFGQQVIDRAAAARIMSCGCVAGRFVQREPFRRRRRDVLAANNNAVCIRIDFRAELARRSRRGRISPGHRS